jgi:hypothetical protein
LGRPTDVAEQPGHHSYTYDPTTRQLATSRLTNDLDEDLLSFSYTYDPTGNVQTIVDQHTGVGTDNLDASASFVYDHRNRLMQRTIGGVSRYFQYDALGNLTGRDLVSPTDPANQLYADPERPHALTQRADGASYAYDADGNAIQRGSASTWRTTPAISSPASAPQRGCATPRSTSTTATATASGRWDRAGAFASS